MKSQLLKTITSIAVLVCLLPLFQNCSSGFEATGISELSSISSTGPKLSVSNAPPALSNSRNISVQINTSVNQLATLSKVTCTLDSNAPVDCLSSFVASGLTDGDHTLKIQAVDSLNNSSDVFMAVWKIDATLPVVTFSQMPPAVSGSATVTAAFAANESATYECQLDAAAFATCVSPLTLTGLSATSHTLKVHGKDLAGNISTDITANFTVNLSAPVINLVNKPVTPTNATSATFTFNGTSGGAAINVFSCQLDSLAPGACNTGTVTYNNIAAGSHTFKVSGQDASGNMSAPTNYTFNIDLAAPALPVISANVTSPTKTTSATFQFSSSDASGIKNYNCQLDSNTVEVCAANTAKTYSNLSSASHVFKVQAVDQAGNVSAFANFNLIVDTALPTITLSQQPTNPTTSTSATFAFTAQDAQTSVALLECKLDTEVFSACSVSKTLSNLALGSHTFTIRATDAANNQALLATTWVINSSSSPTPTPPPAAGCASTVAANTWENKTPPALAGEATFAFGIDPKHSGTIYLGTFKKGIWKSTDCGNTWSSAAINTGFTFDFMIWAMTIDPVTSDIYSTDGYGKKGLLKSTDGGVNWKQLLPQSILNITEGGFVNHISMDPTNHLHLVADFHTFVCTGEAPPGAPVIQGNNYSNPVIVSYTQSTLTGNGTNYSGWGCLVETYDGGATWALKAAPTSWGGADGPGITVIDDKTWFFGQQGGKLWRTTTGGVALNNQPAWTQVSVYVNSCSSGANGCACSGGICKEQVTGSTGFVYQARDGSLYSAGRTALIHSIDGGINWTQISDPYAPSVYDHNGLACIVDTGTTLYVPRNASNEYFTGSIAAINNYAGKVPTQLMTRMPANSMTKGGSMQMDYDPANRFIYSSNGEGGFWRLKAQ